MPWGWDDWRTKDIVSTYMKLDPAQYVYELNPLRFESIKVLTIICFTQSQTSHYTISSSWQASDY